MTKVQRWGNSQGIRLSKTLLAEVDIAVGDEVKVVVAEGAIVVHPARSIHRYDLAALIREIPAEYRVEETDWGSPAGRESW